MGKTETGAHRTGKMRGVQQFTEMNTVPGIKNRTRAQIPDDH